MNETERELVDFFKNAMLNITDKEKIMNHINDLKLKMKKYNIPEKGITYADVIKKIKEIESHDIP